jgi:hypothetical protein
VFATLWQPLLSSITSSSTAQQQHQQDTDRAVTATAAAAAAGTMAAATATANKGSSAQHHQAPALTPLGFEKGQQRHHHGVMGCVQQHVQQQQVASTLRHPRCSLAPIVEQQQKGQEQLESAVDLCSSYGRQQQQQEEEGPPLPFSPTDDASHFASPFATVSAAADEDDALPLETEPLLGPERASASAAPSAAVAAAAAAAVSSLNDSTQQPHSASPPGLSSGPSVFNSGGLRSAPSWLFSARKLLQQQDQQLAAQRLNSIGASSSSSNGGSHSLCSNDSSSGSLRRDKQLFVVVAGEAKLLRSLMASTCPQHKCM